MAGADGTKRPDGGTFSRLTQNWRVLRSHPQLAWLLPGLFITAVGSGMSSVAVAWLALVLAPGPSAPLWVAAALAALYVPGFVGGFTLQRWLGGRSGRFILIVDSSIRAAFFVAIPACFAAGVLTPVLLIGLLVGSSITSAWARGGLHALIAAEVPAEQRLVANSWLMSQNSVATIVGPALGGLVAGVAGVQLVFLVDGATLLVLVLILALRITGTEAPVPSEAKRVSGWRHIRANRDVLSLLMLTFGVGFFFGFFEVALPLHTRDEYGGGPLGLGLLWSLFGVGAAVGAMLSVLYGRMTVWRAAVLTTLLWGTGVAAVGLSPTLLVAAIAMFATGVIYAPYQTVASTFVQSSFTVQQLPAVGATWGAIMMTATPAGYFLGGPAVQMLGARPVVLLSAVATLVVGAVAGLARTSPSRSAGDAAPEAAAG